MNSRDLFVINVRDSPYAKLMPLSLNNVVVKDSFWRPRIVNLIDKTLPLQYEFLEKTGRLDNFRVAAGKKSGGFTGLWFNDSDVYKWVEATAYALVHRWSGDLYEKLANVIKDVADAQESDGYINTFIKLRGLKRWENLAWSHELYCGGHLIQAAIAARRSLNDTVLFSVAKKFGDLIVETFGYDENKLKTSDGHPEIEIALVELYRETRDRRYLDLANFFIDIRGRGYVTQTNKNELFRMNPVYLVDHEHIKMISDFAGSHAVRALYFFTGATDLYLETGDQELLNSLKRLWGKALRKMYITGGFGSRYEGEAFGEDYELPNDRAYSETCASVAGVMWAWRMFLATEDAEYVDILEKILYNAALAGISFDGTKYFYVNPLADYFGKHERQPWYECACCPPNIARLIAYMPSIIYSISKKEPKIWVNLFVGSEADIDLQGNKVKIAMDTNYPWNSRVVVKVNPEKIDEISLMIRIPRWATDTKIRVVDKVFEPRTGTYFELSRRWDTGDTIEIDIPMKPIFIKANPMIEANWGKAAIVRGPFVYAIEQIDNKDFNINNIVIKPDEVNLREKYDPQLFNGVVTIEGDAYIIDYKEDELYHQYQNKDKYVKLGKKVTFKTIPYHLWNNRGKTKMYVWFKSLIF
jgi:DUF1680 family protein